MTGVAGPAYGRVADRRLVELSELRLAVTAPSRGMSRHVRVLLIRNDGSFVWRVRFARLATPEEIQQWAKQTGAAWWSSRI